MHGIGFQIDLKLTKFNGSSFFVKSQSAVLNFCHLTSFFILIYCKMRKIFSCQIIMAIPLNSNVSKGRSVQCIVKSTDTQLNEFGKSPVKKLHELQNTISIITHGKIHNTLLNFKYVCIFDFEYGIGYLL